MCLVSVIQEPGVSKDANTSGSEVVRPTFHERHHLDHMEIDAALNRNICRNKAP